MCHNDLWSTPDNISHCKSLENCTRNIRDKKLCPICGAYLSRITSLRDHVRRHTGDRPFKCDSCEMAFVRRGVLRDHRHKHTNERPFKCPHCDKSFTKKQISKTYSNSHRGTSLSM